jgi:heptosyltransferase-1
VVKTSSLGDVIHTLPAITDADRGTPGIRFDWVVEESLQEVPAWHPAVDRVIPVAIRRWRRQPWRALAAGEWAAFRRALRERGYDRIIDAQGLIKSAVISRIARGRRAGLDRASAREPLASRFYQDRNHIARDQHAITRVRELFARVLGYPLPEGPPDYGLERRRFLRGANPGAYLVFLHGTTWPAKRSPLAFWQELARLAAGQGLGVRLPQGDEEEGARAGVISQASEHVTVLPRLGLTDLAQELAGARAVVGVDTGLAHLAAALSVPSVTLYGPTRPGLTGTRGPQQHQLSVDFSCAPCLSRHCRYAGEAEVYPACYQTLPPERVWATLLGRLASPEGAPHGRTS